MIKRFVKPIYQPYKWIIVVPFVFLVTMILGLICIFTGFLFRQDAANHVALLWARLCCAVVPMQLKIKNRHNYNLTGSYVIVSNHQSMADIPAIHAGLRLNIKWVMKQELRKIPIFGAACHHLGCITVDRSDHKSALRSIENAKNQLSPKASVLFFAEGTRSREGSVMPFKKGAFKFAADTGLPLLPITIKHSADILPPDSMELTPGTIEIVVHPPVHLSHLPTERLEKIVTDTRDAISRAL